MNSLMENFTRNLQRVEKTLKKHSPEILIGVGIVGFISTAVMAAKEAPKAKEKLEDLHEELAEIDEKLSKSEVIFKEVVAVAPVYAPAVISGVLSTVCILGGYKIVSKRSAAFAAAYELASSNLKTYQNKVKELYGDKKEEKVRHEIAQDRVNENPPTSEVVITDGKILFYDSVSGRYFRSTVDEVRQAEKRISDRLPVESWVTLNELYYELGMQNTKLGDELGFNVGEGIDIYFNSLVAPGDVPCLVMEYGVSPRYDYRGY